MRNWLAGKVLRRRRVNPGCPFAKALASWAARTIGAKGRERWNQERRWRKAVKWANADEARRTFEHALWMSEQSIRRASVIAQTLQMGKIHTITHVLASEGQPEPVVHTVQPGPSLDPRALALMIDYHRNVAPQFATEVH